MDKEKKSKIPEGFEYWRRCSTEEEAKNATESLNKMSNKEARYFKVGTSWEVYVKST